MITKTDLARDLTALSGGRVEWTACDEDNWYGARTTTEPRLYARRNEDDSVTVECADKAYGAGADLVAALADLESAAAAVAAGARAARGEG